jgi:hypothetical protein
MGLRRGIRGVAVLAAVVAVLGASAAAADNASVAPPHGGAWKMKPYSFGVAPGSPGIDELTGTFNVTGGGTALVSLKGTTQHGVNSGCNPAVVVKMLGHAAIKHVDQPASAQEYYWVGTGNELWETVKLTFQPAHGRPSTGTGKLRVFFPGGNDSISQGYGIGNLEASNKVIGICNLNFDVR